MLVTFNNAEVDSNTLTTEQVMSLPTEIVMAIMAGLKTAIAEKRVAEKLEITIKTSEKGAISVYGLGRFPNTLYFEQWVRLLDPIVVARILKHGNDGLANGTIISKADKLAADKAAALVGA